MSNFDTVLVANRGEIAVRVIRCARQQGYRAIAVYSEADACALHVSLADEAVLIGPAAVRESYLDANRILDAARRTGAGAIHPGYGLLSENAGFARACAEAGIVFIGPTAEAIEIMGNKAASRRRMLEAGVPCIPGCQSADQSREALLAAAEEIGVPIMVKAAAGGGGRGMRLVKDLAELPVALSSARSEAENAFGSGELILEKALLRPRHVEIQVFGDSQGNMIHLGERDCSIQRRYQKVVEEAPCPVMAAELRDAMGRAAVDAAKSINYTGAGTVEFLLDTDNSFYFLEMNTRLQVEHPVTELVTGEDIVALQFHVAQGYQLPIAQSDVILDGHAIEARLYAEDTANDFLPATGTAHVWNPPTGEGIRVDHGLQQGQEITPFYDPMIAKIVAWGEDRDIARRRLIRALETTSLFGLASNREFLIDVLRKPAFVDGQATTDFIAENYREGSPPTPEPGDLHFMLAACLLYRAAQARSVSAALSEQVQYAGFTNLRALTPYFRFGTPEEPVDVYVKEHRPAHYSVDFIGETHQLQWLQQREDALLVLCDDIRIRAQYALLSSGEVVVQLRGVECCMVDQLDCTWGEQRASASRVITAPMHGNVMAVFVRQGDTVQAGQDVAVMEAMKMEHRLTAHVSGEVAAVYATAGEQLTSGAVVLEIVEHD